MILAAALNNSSLSHELNRIFFKLKLSHKLSWFKFLKARHESIQVKVESFTSLLAIVVALTFGLHILIVFAPSVSSVWLRACGVLWRVYGPCWVQGSCFSVWNVSCVIIIFRIRKDSAHLAEFALHICNRALSFISSVRYNYGIQRPTQRIPNLRTVQ